VAGLGETGGRSVVEARRVGPFRSLADFCRRTKLGRRAVEALVWAGAFDGWGVLRGRLWTEVAHTGVSAHAHVTALVGDRLRRVVSICLARPVVLQSPWNKKISRSA
jgi:DNA polymerase III alpha subunit